MAKRKESTFERLQRGQPLNRRERREVANGLNSPDPGWEIVHPHAAGIDIGNESHYVAVALGEDEHPTREFGSWTADLERMADWLQACGIQSVVMQSTGVYWMAVYDVLQRRGFDVHLVDARGTRNLPGRKSDVQECQWLLKLHTYGLLRRCFLPGEEIRRVRTVWRLRDQHVKEAGRAVQHMQKALTEMNVQVHNTISDLSGVTGQAIVRAILEGERDAARLAALRDSRIQASEPELVQSLRGNWQEDALFELRQAVEAYDFYRQQMKQCDAQLEQYLAALPSREPVAAPPTAETPEASRKRPVRRGFRKPRKAPGNQPALDLRTELQRILGVDATSIDGIEVMTVQTVVAEVGADLSAWKTERHWASWLNLAPKREVSGGRVIRHTREHRTNRVGNAFRMAAQSLIRSESYLGARFRYLRAKLGGIKAVKAMARTLACLYYRFVTRGQAWVDRGAAEFERRRQEREFAMLQRKAGDFAMKLVPAV